MITDDVFVESTSSQFFDIVSGFDFFYRFELLGLDDISHRRQRKNRLHLELATKPLAHDIHMQRPEKPTTETLSQCIGTLGLITHRTIIECEFFHSFDKLGIVARLYRINTRKNKRLRNLKSWHRQRSQIFALFLGIVAQHRVTDLRVSDGFLASDDVSDLSFGKSFVRHILRCKIPDFGRLDHRFRIDQIKLGSYT